MSTRPNEDATFAELAVWLIGASTQSELKLLFHMALQIYMLRMEWGVAALAPTVDTLRSGQLRLELLPLLHDADAEAALMEVLKQAAA